MLFYRKFVRVGELNLQTKVDCEHFETETLCGDPYVDIPVRRAIIHEKYQRKTLKNDIALIHLAEKIKFTGKYSILEINDIAAGVSNS